MGSRIELQQESLEKVLVALLERPWDDESFVSFEEWSSGKFVQISRLSSGPLSLDLSVDALSRSEKARAEEYFRQRGISSGNVEAQDQPVLQPLIDEDCFQIRFGHDHRQAARTVLEIMQQVYQFPDDLRIRINRPEDREDAAAVAPRLEETPGLFDGFDSFNLSTLNFWGWSLFLSTIAFMLLGAALIAHLFDFPQANRRQAIQVPAIIIVLGGCAWFVGWRKLFEWSGTSIRRPATAKVDSPNRDFLKLIGCSLLIMALIFVGIAVGSLLFDGR